VQAFAVLVAINLNLLYPSMFVPPVRYMITSLVPYEPPIHQEPQPVNPRLLAKPIKPVKPEVTEAVVEKEDLPPLPKPKAKPAEPVSAPEVKHATMQLPNLPQARPVPKAVATNTFSTGSSVMPTTTRPAAMAQTGGFGDPNGVPAREGRGHAVNINAFGSWDLPGGPGHGNGTGGAHGVPGVAVSAGFGNGVAVGSPHGGGGGAGTVRQAGFADSRPVPEAPQQKKVVAGQSPTTPVEILFKPKPAYTPEGRSLKIEGEVRLEVQFTASGQVRVIRVLQGLGHGLDEQAVHAAEQIRFKPAQREGQPVDSNATLHIVFQLA
jgi:TonB family protein